MLNTLDLSNLFPSYLNIETLTLVLTSLIVYLLFTLVLKSISLRLYFAKQYIFLEIKPTDRTLKTAFTTTQLFIMLHSLETPYSWWEKFIQIRKNISYELVSTKNEGIRFILRVPKENSSSIRKALLAYLPGIEIKEVNDYLPNTTDTSSVIREFTLSNLFVYPLSKQETLNQYDPLAYLTAHMTKLQVNDLIMLQFTSIPIHESTHASKADYINSLKKKLLNNEDISDLLVRSSFRRVIDLIASSILFIVLTPITLVSWLFTNTKDPFPSWVFESVNKRTQKDLGEVKRELYENIGDKLSQPLFESRVSVFISISNKENAIERLQGIKSSFDTFSSSHQSLKLKTSISNILKSNLLKNLDYFFLKKRFSFFESNTILSATELSSLFHLPYTSTTKTEDLLQVKSPKLPAPISLKKSDLELDITFAHNTYGETTTPIGLTLEERRRHAYIIGATGTGKTTLLLQMINQDIKKGNGIAVIDPHGDLAERLLEVIPKERIKDVVYFNPYDVEFPIGLNVLEIPEGLSNVELQREKDFITSTLISIFHKLYDARYSGPRMEHILRNVILTALEQEKPTLFTIYNLLTNTKYRKDVTSLLNDEILKTFWKNEFEKLGSFQKAEQISPITNKLGRFLTTGMTRNILNQTESKLDFEDIMNGRKILICNLSKGKIGEDTAYFLGGLLTAKIQLTALRRVHVPEKKRTDFFLYIDEFQNFATMSFAQILSEARKYRLSVILAHQNTVQIENDLLETIIGNSGTLICFRTTSPKDEDKLLPVFLPEVEKGQMANIPSYNFYMKINAIQPQSTFSGEIENFVIPSNEEVRREVIKHSQTKYGQTPKPLHAKNKTSTEKVITKIDNTANLFEQIRP